MITVATTDSQVRFQGTIPWCEEGGQNDFPNIASTAPRPFVQGFTAYGDILVSPIDLQATALSAKEAQNLYYSYAQSMGHRRGPINTDAGRLRERLVYTTRPFTTPFVLLTPPLITQTRAEHQARCPDYFGQILHDFLWNSAADSGGVICDNEHTCPIPNSSVNLLSCRADQQPLLHFGRTARYGKFEEFLTSIAETPLFVRAPNIIAAAVEGASASGSTTGAEPEAHAQASIA